MCEEHQATEQFRSRARAGAKALPCPAGHCPSHQAPPNCPQDPTDLLSLLFLGSQSEDWGLQVTSVGYWGRPGILVLCGLL